MHLDKRRNQNKNKFRHRILPYLVILIVFFALQCTLITYWELRKHGYRNVIESEAKQCVQMIRNQLPSWIHHLNSRKIVLNKLSATRYEAIAYGFYGGIWTEMNVDVQLSYKASIEQGIPFSCKGSISSKTFAM